jgi:hypothetical protein
LSDQLLALLKQSSENGAKKFGAKFGDLRAGPRLAHSMKIIKKAFSYDQRIGWLHGLCLAISNPKLTPGTAVAVVITGKPQVVERAQIQGQADSSENAMR